MGNVILCGPSGSGKGTLRKMLCEERSDIHVTVSCTTRAARPGEIDGRDYHFITRHRFMELQTRGAFLEWAEYSGELYGTPRSELLDGHVNLIEIEICGARQVKALSPEIPLIFVITPTIEDLRRRILTRGDVTPEKLEGRLQRAPEELREGIPLADFVIMNRDGQLARAYAQFKHVLSL